MDNDLEQSVPARRQQQQPPVSTTLTTSSSTCAIDGKPPFTITTMYECTKSRPIWALVRLFTDFGNGIQIRDPLRDHRRMGPISTIADDDWDDAALDLNDTKLVRLEPGQKFSTSYVISVVSRTDGLRPSDVKQMIKGNTYEITLRTRRWSWMFEGEIREGLSEEERREILRKREAIEWKVDNIVTFEAA